MEGAKDATALGERQSIQRLDLPAVSSSSRCMSTSLCCVCCWPASSPITRSCNRASVWACVCSPDWLQAAIALDRRHTASHLQYSITSPVALSVLFVRCAWPSAQIAPAAVTSRSHVSSVRRAGGLIDHLRYAASCVQEDNGPARRIGTLVDAVQACARYGLCDWRGACDIAIAHTRRIRVSTGLVAPPTQATTDVDVKPIAHSCQLFTGGLLQHNARPKRVAFINQFVCPGTVGTHFNGSGNAALSGHEAADELVQAVNFDVGGLHVCAFAGRFLISNVATFRTLINVSCRADGKHRTQQKTAHKQDLGSITNQSFHNQPPGRPNHS